MKNELQKSKCLWIGVGLIYFPILFFCLWVGPVFAFGVWSLFALPIIGALASFASKQSNQQARALKTLAFLWLTVFALVWLLYWRVYQQDAWLADDRVNVVFGIGYLVAPLFFWGLTFQQICRCSCIDGSPTDPTQ